MSDDDRDIWGRTLEEQASSASMNSMFAAMRDSKAARPIGELTGGPSPETAREALSQTLGALEAAERRGDVEDVGLREHQLDSLIEQSRLSRATAEQARDAETGQFVSFDGGVRREGRRRPTPGGYAESSNSLFRRMIQRSGEEKRERETETTLT